MGNTSSSAGVSFGSLFGMILLAPLTGGSSLVVGACAVGAAGGAVAAIAHGNDNPGTRTDFGVGVGCGIVSAVCAGGAALGADAAFSIGTSVGGQIVGIGYRSGDNTGHKPKLFVGTSEQAMRANQIVEKFEIRRQEFSKLEVYGVMSRTVDVTQAIMKNTKVIDDPVIGRPIRNIITTKNIVFFVMSDTGRKPAQWINVMTEPGPEKSIWNKIFEVLVYLACLIHSTHDLMEYDMRAIGPTINIIDKHLKEHIHDLIESLKKLGGQERPIQQIRDYYPTC